MIKRVFGQALHENRPNLVGKGFITPLIRPSEFKGRRQKLLDKMSTDSIAIIPGNCQHFATPSVFYPFRQDPNFQYLTGFLEPSACLVLRKTSAGSESLLFVAEKNAWEEKWEGHRTGKELAPQIFEIDTALPVSDLRKEILGLLSSAKEVLVDLEPKVTVRQGPFFNHELPEMVGKQRISKGTRVKELSPLVASLRSVKSEAEIDCLRIAAEGSATAYNRAFKQEFATERQLHTFLNFMFTAGGCDSEAYLPVVAGGSNALTIHYVQNDDVLNPGDLVLVDAGGRYGGYCADISRTWPVNGRFNGPQRDLYEAVLSVEKECIKLCTESNNMSMVDIHRKSETLMAKELQNAGLHIAPHHLSQVYPHMIGHHLGLDVHDGGHNSALGQNNVVTIEPGVYVPFDDKFPKHFQGIGIRIEDNVAVGRLAPEILTIDTLKEVDEIER